MKYLLGLIILSLISCRNNQKDECLKFFPSNDNSDKLEVLLIGTFHFSNFEPQKNYDISQTIEVDVLSKHNQMELELISNKVADFKPDKIFVEYPYARQKQLDSIYKYFVPSDFESKERDEGDQLAFRIAKQLNHKQVYGCDFRGFSFPYDSMINSMEMANQYGMIASDKFELEQWEKKYNETVNRNKSLLDVLYFLNDEQERLDDIGWFLNSANKAGTLKDTIGNYLTSQWYNRNLKIYSAIQKTIDEKDKRIMILLGSSHTAILKDFIDKNRNWTIVELNEVMGQNFDQ
jgi:hypothetical protein